MTLNREDFKIILEVIFLTIFLYLVAEDDSVQNSVLSQPLDVMAEEGKRYTGPKDG